MTYRIKENSYRARLAAWKLSSNKVAIVFGSTIYLYNASREELLANNRWLRHELKHIEQYKRFGFFTFLFLYIAETIRNGYVNNKFEVEAREAEKDDSTNYLKKVL